MTKPPPTLLIFSRHLMQDRLAGNSAHVRSLIDFLRANGIRVVLLIPSLRGLGRKPFARVPLDRGGFDAVIVSGGLRIGAWLVRYAPAVWGRAAGVLAARVLRRLRGGERSEEQFWDLGPIDRGERRAIRAAARRVKPQAAFANYFYLAEALADALFADIPKLTMVHDVFFARVESFQAGGVQLPHAPVTRERELADLGHADTLLSVQEAEAALLRSLLPDRRTLLMPISFPIAIAGSPPEPDTILFVGGDNQVNVVGIEWMLSEVWPLLRAARPEARLRVCGRVARRVPLAPAGVELVGPVDDLTAEYHRAALCVVPLRAGSGQKVKLVEALCHGRAVVATSVGAQGFEALIGSCFLLADDAAGFAEACLRVLTDPALRAAMEQASLREARVRFSEEACYGAVLQRLRANGSASP